jgi:hypothetical protein
MVSLQLLTVQHPGNPSLAVSLYETASAACRHLRNHVLTAPECQAWAVVQPQFLEVVDLNDANARWQFCQRIDRLFERDAAEETPNSDLQQFYNHYATAVQEAAASARRLGWHAQHENRRVTVALGLNGILQVYKRTLTTAFLPGHGSAYETLAARRENRPRRDSAPETLADTARGMRTGRRRSARAAAREHRRRQTHLADQSLEAKRYHVFRKAVQAIRADNRVALSGDGTYHSTADYALLKAVLPPMSKLGLSDWLSHSAGGVK